MFNALKYGPSKTSPQELIHLLAIDILALAQQGELPYIEAMFRYLCEAKDSKFSQRLLQEFQTRLKPQLEEDFMTSIADSFREEGIQQGIQQNMHLVMHEMLLEGLTEASIVKITKLSLKEIRLEAKKIQESQVKPH
jgi:hypothetical protein